MSLKDAKKANQGHGLSQIKNCRQCRPLRLLKSLAKMNLRSPIANVWNISDRWWRLMIPPRHMPMTFSTSRKFNPMARMRSSTCNKLQNQNALSLHWENYPTFSKDSCHPNSQTVNFVPRLLFCPSATVLKSNLKQQIESQKKIRESLLVAPLLSFIDILKCHLLPIPSSWIPHLSRSRLRSHRLWHRPQVGQAAARGHLQSWAVKSMLSMLWNGCGSKWKT